MVARPPVVIVGEQAALRGERLQVEQAAVGPGDALARTAKTGDGRAGRINLRPGARHLGQPGVLEHTGVGVQHARRADGRHGYQVARAGVALAHSRDNVVDHYRLTENLGAAVDRLLDRDVLRPAVLRAAVMSRLSHVEDIFGNGRAAAFRNGGGDLRWPGKEADTLDIDRVSWMQILEFFR